MTHDFLVNVWFLLLTLVWSIYIIQEGFVIGVSVLSYLYKKESEVKKLNLLVGTHWDGIEVWLVLAIAGQFAAFPAVFAETLTNLYVVFFLLLYIIIARGVSIETIYKTDSAKVKAILVKTWQISSALLIIVIGVYLVNLFIGLKLSDDYSVLPFLNFIYIFNKTAIMGGVMFLAYSLVSGYNFIVLNYGKEGNEHIKEISKWASVVVAVLAIFIFMALNNKYNAFDTVLYNNTIMFSIPVLSMVMLTLSAVFTWADKTLFSFITHILGMVLFIFAGFTSSMPYALKSRGDSNSITMLEGAAGEKTLELMLYVAIIFLPVIFSYVVFKYIRFWGK